MDLKFIFHKNNKSDFLTSYNALSSNYIYANSFCINNCINLKDNKLSPDLADDEKTCLDNCIFTKLKMYEYSLRVINNYKI